LYRNKPDFLDTFALVERIKLEAVSAEYFFVPRDRLNAE
jgi:hypothetical protein